MAKLVYVCIPYSYNPELSFAIANEVSGTLMEMGYVVFSPVSMTHPIADYLPKNLKSSHSFFMSQDLPILRKCDELCIVYIGDNGKELVEQSKGCMEEIAEANKHNIKTWVYNYILDYESTSTTY